MSAWQVGRRGTASSYVLDPDQGGVKTYIDRVVKWIPGDVLGIYGAGIVALKSQDPDPNPSVGWLVIGLVFAPVVVLLATWADGGPFKRAVFANAFLALFAFAIWSFSVPESGWARLEVVRANPGLVAVGSAAAGLLFGLFAEGVSKRL